MSHLRSSAMIPECSCGPPFLEDFFTMASLTHNYHSAAHKFTFEVRRVFPGWPAAQMDATEASLYIQSLVPTARPLPHVMMITSLLRSKEFWVISQLYAVCLPR